MDSLNPSLRCGFNSNLRQIRPIVDFDNPERSAIDLRDQCVAFFGVCSNVAVTTSSTLSSRIEGGLPGRGSSTKPSSRRATNCRRHLVTVFGATRRSAATCLFVAPDAQASTIRARTANACADFARRDQRTNRFRSPAVSTNSAFGRPGPSQRRSPRRDRDVPGGGCRAGDGGRLKTSCGISRGRPPGAAGVGCRPDSLGLLREREPASESQRRRHQIELSL